MHGIRYQFEEWAKDYHPRLEYSWVEKTERYRDPKTDMLWRCWLAATLNNWSDK